MTARTGWLHVEAWGGQRLSLPVAVLGETSTAYRVRLPPEASRAVKCAGRRRTFPPGGTAHVPRAAVTFDRND